MHEQVKRHGIDFLNQQVHHLWPNAKTGEPTSIRQIDMFSHFLEYCNEGCVEAAVISGRLAAHALSKSPPLEEIIGYD